MNRIPLALLLLATPLARAADDAAVRSLTESRAALTKLLNDRIAADAAQAGANVDVLLDLDEALVTCGNQRVRPKPGRAPQWSDMAGLSLDRMYGATEEFQRAREDVQMLFRRRGDVWFPPRFSLLSSKFLAAFHFKGAEDVAFDWSDQTFSGRFALASSGGDRRYQMHHSGEGSFGTLPEFRMWKDLTGEFWRDWWLGPRERLHGSTDAFAVDGAVRRGWLLKALLLAPTKRPTAWTSPDQDLYVWIEDGRVQGGFAIIPGRQPGRGPELLINAENWSLKDQKLEAEFVLTSDVPVANRWQPARRWQISARLPAADAGAFVGEYREVLEKGDPKDKAATVRETMSGVAEGTLYHAYVGNYNAKGVDGERTGTLLVGVAPARVETKVQWPEVAIGKDASPAALFSNVVELAGQVAALDWALREYPMPLAEALRCVREGRDDRHTYYPTSAQFYRKQVGSFNADQPLIAQPHMHEALAALLGPEGTGAAAYAERLAQIARATVVDRQQKAQPALGIGTPEDPDFGPYAGQRLATVEAGANQLPASDWAMLDDWTCHGFIMRQTSFETGPYLPELALRPGLLPDGKELEFGKPVRLARPDPGEQLWVWRARPDEKEGRVLIPRECLYRAKSDQEFRTNTSAAWDTKTKQTRDVLDFFYDVNATWYGATAIRSEKAQRIWMAARSEWDGRVWVNDRLVWRPTREHTPDQIAVFPVDLQSGLNLVTVSCTARPVGDGNVNVQQQHIRKYGEKSMGSFAVWVAASGSTPRPAATVAAAHEKQQKADVQGAAAKVSSAMRGRRGDGSGLYPEANPPLAWDIEKGINIRWKTSLPTDDTEPVIVGDRLFITTYTGEMVCLNAETGAELWRKKPELNGAAPATNYPPDAISSSFGQPQRMWGRELPETIKPRAPYARSCLTAAANLKCVWMHDPRGVVACFDHAGNQRWAQVVPAQTPRFTLGIYVQDRLLLPTHPAAIGSRLIVAVGEGLTAFDLETGKVAWQRASLDYLGQFAVMEPVDGVGEGLVLLSSAEVLDAATGETLIARCAPLVPDAGCEPVVSGRTAYFAACSSAVRFWRNDNGALCSRLLWHTATDIKRRQLDMNHQNRDLAHSVSQFSWDTGYPPTPVLVGDLLIEHMAEQMSIDHGPQQSMRLHTWDAATGCAVSQRYALQVNATHPVNSTIVAGGYVFCGDEGGIGKGDYPSFPQSPSMVIVTAEEQPRRVTRWQPGLASMAPPTFQGDRMYLAGEDQVVCVGRPKGQADRLTEYEVAALKDGFFTQEIGATPEVGSATEMRLEPPAAWKPGEGVPVVRLVSGKTPNQWMFAGPFFVDEDVDVFKDRGGAGAIHPLPGQTVAYTQTKEAVPKKEGEYTPIEGRPATAAWRVLDPNASTYDKKTARASFDATRHIIMADYAAAMKNPRLTGGINFATAADRQYFTTCYAYTVLDVDKADRYRVERMGSPKIKNTEMFLAGRPIEKGMILELPAGRYPFMVRAALGVCGNWEPLDWAMQLVSVGPRGEPLPPPEPVAEPLPPGLDTPVSPLLLASLPPRLLGAWPLNGDLKGNPLALMTGNLGALITTNTRVNLDGQSVAFRPLPPGGTDTPNKRGTADALHFNALIGDWGAVELLGLSEPALFGDASPATGLFYGLVRNPRSLCLQAQHTVNVRCWLNGREIRGFEVFNLKPGLYPFLLQFTSDEKQAVPVVPNVFIEVADPSVAMERWQARVQRNADLLRRIAEAGPAGAYAQTALDSVKTSAAEQQSPQERMTP